MPSQPKKFKRPPKKYQPKGLTILYEDHDILVVDKTHGLLTMGTEKIRENTAQYRLSAYVKKGNSKSRNRVFIVHRLDRDTSGVLVFAKHPGAKRYLQDEWQGFTKTYYAVVEGKLAKKEGVITSRLTENRAHRVYAVNDPGQGKLAKTGYRVIKETDRYSLLEIELHTGRKHQIRVHFSDAGHPVVGDKIYGSKAKGTKRLALHAASISLRHPHTHEEMTFEAPVPDVFRFLMSQ